MTRRGDELDAEAAQVPTDRSQDIYVGFARIAAAGATCRSFNDRPNSRREAPSKAMAALCAAVAGDEILAPRRRHLVMAGKRDCARAADRFALAAEETPPRVEGDAAAARVAAEGAGRTDGPRTTAGLLTLCGVDNRAPANRSGNSGGGPAGYRMVRCPCFQRASNTSNIVN